jgi:hypothetical protein
MFMYAIQVNSLSIVPIFQVHTFFYGCLCYAVGSFVISTYVVVSPVWESEGQNCSMGVYIAAGYGAYLWLVGVFTSWYSRLGTCDLAEAINKGLVRYGKCYFICTSRARFVVVLTLCRFVLVRRDVFSD